MTQHPGDDPATPAPHDPYSPGPPPYGEPPVYGAPASEGPAPAPPPPPPGYGAPTYGTPGYSAPGQGGQGAAPGYSPSGPGYGPAPGYGPGPGSGYPPPPPGRAGGPSTGPGGPGPVGPDVNEDRQWALFAHLGGVLAIFPVVHLLPALVILTVYRRRSEFVRDQAREALNFQIVVLIALVAVWIINHLPLLPNLVALVWIFSLVFSVLGAMAASQGERYRYPITRRFLT